MNFENNVTDDELSKIFSKHHDSDLTKKSLITFNENDINKNKKEIEDFRNHNLIKSEKHFNLEDEDDIFNIETDKKEKKNKKDDYFNKIMQETLDNDNLYCSYLDYFDKIWMNNNSSKNINYIKFQDKENSGHTLSCAGCFNTVSYNANSLKYKHNIYTSDSLVNSYVDFMEILNTDDLIDLLKSNLNFEKNKSKSFKSIQLKELGIDDVCQEKLQYVCIKCKNCLNIIGVCNSQNNKYILFNTI